MYKDVYRALFVVAQNWKQHHILNDSLSSTLHTLAFVLFSECILCLSLLYKNVLCSKVCLALPTSTAYTPCSQPLPQTCSTTGTMAFHPHACARSSCCLDISICPPSILFVCMEISNLYIKTQTRYYLLPEAFFKLLRHTPSSTRLN